MCPCPCAAAIQCPQPCVTRAPKLNPKKVWSCADDLQPAFAQIDRRVAANLRKVQQAFREERIGPHHFQGSTGYGHGDLGREALDNVSCVVVVFERLGLRAGRSGAQRGRNCYLRRMPPPPF